MQITLVQSELEDALRQYIDSLLALQPGTQMAIKWFATRGETGFSASVDITKSTVPAPAEAKDPTAPIRRSNAAGNVVQIPTPTPTASTAPTAVTAAATPPRSPAQVREMMAKEAVAELDTSSEEGGEEEATTASAEETVEAATTSTASEGEAERVPEGEKLNPEGESQPRKRSLFGGGLRKP